MTVPLILTLKHWWKSLELADSFSNRVQPLSPAQLSSSSPLDIGLGTNSSTHRLLKEPDTVREKSCWSCCCCFAMTVKTAPAPAPAPTHQPVKARLENGTDRKDFGDLGINVKKRNIVSRLAKTVYRDASLVYFFVSKLSKYFNPLWFIIVNIKWHFVFSCKRHIWCQMPCWELIWKLNF